jgi:chemotaxis protein CheZ
MKENLKAKIVDIVDGKLTDNEIEELVDFFKYALIESFDQDDEHFFKDLALEMSSSVKDLALLIIDFRKDLKSKIHPGITDLTEKYIPQTADQLEGIIETTEDAANKIMDNLEAMQEDQEKLAQIIASAKSGKIELPAEGDITIETELGGQVMETIKPLVDRMALSVDNSMAMIAEIFVQMSFQDLTGQRIKRVMSLVSQMEARLKKMVVSFGIKIAEKEKNPDITEEELAYAVAIKETELAGPQKSGCGLDQAGIDDLLANI